MGLYEWSRDKQAAMKKKQEDIEAGIRQKYPTPEDSVSRDSSPEPEQRVPDRREVRRPEERKRYRSRSRSRSRTRSRSGSRGSTPPRRSDAGRRRSRSREQQRGHRSRSRSRGRRDRTRSRSRSRGDRRRRSRSRSGSGDFANLPSNLTRRSPTPPSRAGWGSASSSGGQ